MATSGEIEQYLAIEDDARAAAFIEAFWQRRNPFPTEPGNQTRERFEERAVEADKRFSQAGYAGRRTARGSVFVLFGEPTKVSFDIEKNEPARALEVWAYDPPKPGLGGDTSLKVYRFVKDGDLVVLLGDATRVLRLPPRTNRF